MPTANKTASCIKIAVGVVLGVCILILIFMVFVVFPASEKEAALEKTQRAQEVTVSANYRQWMRTHVGSHTTFGGKLSAGWTVCETWDGSEKCPIDITATGLAVTIYINTTRTKSPNCMLWPGAGKWDPETELIVYDSRGNVLRYDSYAQVTGTVVNHKGTIGILVQTITKKAP